MSARADARQRVKRPGGTSPEPTVEVRWGLAFELLLGPRMFVDTEDPTTYEVGPDWFEEVRARTPAAVLGAVARFSGGHEPNFGNLLGLVSELAPPPGAVALIDALEAIDPLRLRLQILGHQLEVFRHGVPRDLIEAAAGGDRGAAKELVARQAGEMSLAAEHALSLDAVEAKELLVTASRGWYEHVLRPRERTTARLLRGDAEQKASLVGRMPAAALVELTTNGVALPRDPGIERVLLVPGLTHRPWVVMSESYGTMIFAYALTTGSAPGADDPPEELVRLSKALGDETRLRLLRALRDGPRGLQELADQVGLAKSTVHGHMLVLRTSGLVRASAADKRYTIRSEGLERAKALLDDWVGGEGA